MKTAYKYQFKRVSRKNPCPVCQHTDWCEISVCGLAAHCMRVPSNREMSARQGGWLHVLGTNDNINITAADLRLIDVSQEPVNEPKEILSPEMVDKINRRFLELCPLSPDHNAYLLNENVTTTGIGTFDRSDSWIIAHKLVSEFGLENCSKHPIFDGGKLAIKSSGILFPAINGLNQILGVQIRFDKPRNPKNRYVWFSKDASSKGYSTPLMVFAGFQADTCLLTEGYKKGELASRYFGTPSIAFGGVTGYKLADLLSEIDRLGVKKLVIALDQDKHKNPNVLQAEEKLTKSLLETRPGLQISVLNWNLEQVGKGVDDAIKSGANFTHSIINLPVDTTLNERYLPILDFWKKKVTLVKSPKNTGKTEMISRLVSQTKKIDGKVISINHRIALGKAQATRWGMDFYLNFENLTNANEQMTDSKALVICGNSLPKLVTNKIKTIDLLIIDEVEQFLAHLTTGVKKDERALVLATLKFLIRRAKKIVCLDADLSPVTYKFFERLVGTEHIQVVVNEFVLTGKTFVKYEKKSELIEQLVKDLEAGKKCFIASNGKNFTDNLYQLLTKKFPGKRGWLINRDTAGNGNEQAAIEHINQSVTHFDYLLASPTLGTGVSIDVVHFDSVYLFGDRNVNTHFDLLQQAGRVRNPTDGKVHCWISKDARKFPTNPENIKSNELSTLKETALHVDLDIETGERVAAEHEKFYFDLWADLKAAKNTSWLDLAGNFYSQAAKEGNTVIEAGQEVTCSEETKADYKAAKEAVKQERIDGLLAAKDINELTYKYLKDSTSGKTKEVKAQIERYEMARFYGLPVTKELIELDKEGRFRRNIENFLSIMKPEYSKVIDRANLSNPQIMLADVSHLNVQAQCRFNVLAKAGLIGDTFAQFDADSLNKSGFVTWLKENQSRIERVLNMSINLDLPVQTLASVLGQIGLKLKDKQVRATDGKRKRIYQIDQENYFKVEDMAKAHFEAFEKRRNDKEQGVIVSAIRYEELPLKVA